MNANRIEKIVNRIAKKRIAMEDSPYTFFEVWKLAKRDPNAEVFLYDDIVTGDIHRGNFPKFSHEKLVKNIYDENEERIMELQKLGKIFEEDDYYATVTRGYWLPEMNVVFFHDNPNEERVSDVLRKMNIETEEIYAI